MVDSIEIGNFGESGETERCERADAAANRLLILQTAETLFNRLGVDQVTMADVAQTAGVGKGTLYRRYGNKAELCLALMDTQMSDFQNGMLGRMRQLTDQGKSNLEMLDQFLDALVHFTDIHMPLLCEVDRSGLLAQEQNLDAPHYWQYLTINGLLRSAETRGELRSGMDVDFLSEALLATLRADIFRYQREVRGYSLERISAGLRSIVASYQVDPN